MTLKYKLLLLFFLLAAVPAFLGLGCYDSEKPVAIVNDQSISRSDLDIFINLMRLCNPDLDSILEQKNYRVEIEREFLRIMIDLELVKQEIERTSLSVNPALVQKKTDILLDALLNTHYAGSWEELDRRRKQLGLSLADLAAMPRYELQILALFEHVTAFITETDLYSYVEENPELLRQEAALELYWFLFIDEQAAGLNLARLEQGLSVEKLAAQLSDDPQMLHAASLGWVTGDYPFLEERVIELIFQLPQSGRGYITELAGRFNLYWIYGHRPEAVRSFDDVKGEAALLRQYTLYQDYFKSLWSEGRIEVFL